MENIRLSCPQSNLNCFLLCTVNFAVKLLFLSGFCMIYCVDLGEGYTGRFIMFSVITNIYNNKTKESTLMELFTATGKLKKFFFDN